MVTALVAGKAHLDPELDRLARIEGLLDAPVDLPAGQQRVRAVVLHYERAELTGRDLDLAYTEALAVGALADGINHEDLVLTLARVHLSGHELGRAEALLEEFPRAAGTRAGRSVLAAVLRQRGSYLAAARIYVELARLEPTWSSIAGLAGVFDDLGDVDTADGLYRRAEDEIDASQLEALSWVELQRAALARRGGNWRRAEAHTRRAEAAGGGGWQVGQMWASLSSRSGDWPAAARRWHEVVAQTGRPDHAQSFGNALFELGRLDDAAAWHKRALDGYEESAALGRSRYRHHFAEFCVEVLDDLARAERLAQADFADRPNHHAGVVLARIMQARGRDRWSRRLMEKLDAERTTALGGLRAELAGAVDA